MKYSNNTLFFHLDNNLLFSLRHFNLNFATHPSMMYLDKFVRALNSHKIPFIYTINAVPISYSLFCSECAKYLNLKTEEALKGIVFIIYDDPKPRYIKYPREEFQNWLNMRTGIWKTTLSVSTAAYKVAKRLKYNDFLELNEHIAMKSKVLLNSFEENFITLKLKCLINQLLVSGFLSECFKNTVFRLNGTQLNYLYFQGKTLHELVKVANEFKKGIDTRIAAEFNTPTQLDNSIVIGKTINTEFLEEESPLGFTFDQLKQLFITNG
ncbi:MAG: hypothetical protein ACFFB0_18670, partial [Promethearchaeota archaeon]